MPDIQSSNYDARNNDLAKQQDTCMICDTKPVIGGHCRCGHEAWEGPAWVDGALDPHAGDRMRQTRCMVCETRPVHDGTCRCGRERWVR